MESFAVELTVANQCGVLNRITGVYAKQKYNIDRLTVTETNDPAISVIRIVSKGDATIQSQLARQLRKLFDVKTVVLSGNVTL